jgi:hypothetical protein
MEREDAVIDAGDCGCSRVLSLTLVCICNLLYRSCNTQSEAGLNSKSYNVVR